LWAIVLKEYPGIGRGTESSFPSGEGNCSYGCSVLWEWYEWTFI